MAFCLMEGNEAIGRGAVAAGCRFFAGYPITPATTINDTMLKLLPPLGGFCMQGEDEIASIGFCLGASMAGLKVMIATSGPGISLCSEQISFAIAGEIPIVIVDVQRLGPSTGSATQGADGDIQFLQWGTSGGFPVIVLAPVDVADCFALTVQAFNLAERYRCPVFIASNKEVAMTRETVDLEAISLPEIEDRQRALGDGLFLPFQPNPGRFTPDFLPIGDVRLVRQTSSTHGPDGYITTDSRIIEVCQERLKNKILADAHRLTFFEEIQTPGADTLVITHGVTARAARDAVFNLNARARAVSMLILKTLWPVPEALIREKGACVIRIVVIEMNLGQYVREIRRVLGDKPVFFFGRMNGELLTPGEIAEAIDHG